MLPSKIILQIINKIIDEFDYRVIISFYKDAQHRWSVQKPYI